MTEQEGFDGLTALPIGIALAFTGNGLALIGWWKLGLPLPEALPLALVPVAVTSLPTLLLHLVGPEFLPW